MVQMGLPRCFTAWFKAFLTDRQACVRLNGARSKFRLLRDGTPQGAVTSPTLFNILINDITDGFPEKVNASLFADDLAIWSQHQDIRVAEGHIQRALDALGAWATKWKMAASPEKTVSTVFTLDPAEAQKEATLTYLNHAVKHTQSPTFLGVTLDRTLTFNKHIDNVKRRMKQRNNVLRAISGTKWGCAPSDLRAVYMAFSRAVADYAAGAWMPGESASSIKGLDVAQRQASRTITGCVLATPVGELDREAGLEPFSVRRRMLAAVAVEKHSRGLPGDPVQKLLLPDNRPRRRLRHDRGWVKTGLETTTAAGLADLPREPLLITASAPPWEPDPENVRVHTRLARAVRRDAPAEARRKAAEDTLRQLPPADIEVYTDGSAAAGTENGGAGVVIWEGPREAKKIQTPAGKYTSSYQAELYALNTALNHLESSDPGYVGSKTIRVCTDSQSALMRLAEGHANQTEPLPDEIWTRLKRIGRRHRVDLQWIPGHAGIPGNEIADEVAKQAAALNHTHQPGRSQGPTQTAPWTRVGRG